MDETPGGDMYAVYVVEEFFRHNGGWLGAGGVDPVQAAVAFGAA